MTSSKLQTLLFSVVLVLATSVSLYGQSTFGTVDGAVTDPSGAAVAGANVTLTNTGTQEKHTQPTGDAGLYQFVNVEPGNYRLDIERTGFKHFARTNVVVEVQQDTHIDAALTVGQVSETVEVTAETPLLQAETSSLGQVVEQRKANELPLNGRNIFNLLTVSPGVVSQGGAGGTAVGQNPFSWGNYQVAGSFANQGAEYLDGQPLNIGYINLPIIIPTQDSIGEFKVQYNNVDASWGKFSGAVSNFSTKSGTNSFHGEAYEFLRNKVLNSNDYFYKNSELVAGLPNSPPPYVQNNYGFNVGGPIWKNHTFFFTSWEQYRQRAVGVVVTTVPIQAFRQGDFSALLSGATPVQLYDPFTVYAPGGPTPYPNNQIPISGPTSEASTAALALWDQYYTPIAPSSTTFDGTPNFTSAASGGGNTTQFVTRIDQNISDRTRIFGRFTYNGLLDLPTNPLGTGLCLDRCAEDYHTKALAIDINHSFSPTLIGDLNISGSRFIYLRSPILSGYDLTKLGWPASYNDEVPSIMRTPPTPAFPYTAGSGDIGKSQGNSAIGDHNTQYNISPSLSIIRGKHTVQVGGQYELGLDNYYQTNIASGAFGFLGSWTGGNGLSAGNPFADFLLGLSQNGPASFVNQTEGAAQVPAETAGRQAYRALYANDNWHIMPKLTLNLGLRYELAGTWSERFNRLSYWNPNAVNSTVTGCDGTAGSTSCPGDAFLVGTGPNSSQNNLPMDKKEFSPRVGFAYSLDQKTVIRGGYGVFWIPNFISFALNPDNDVINLATTPFFASTNHNLSPSATLDESGCGAAPTYTNFAEFSASCLYAGPFGATGILAPPGRNNYPAATPTLSSFVAANGNPTLAPYLNPKPGYVEQWNVDIQRQLPAGFFADVAYAGSHGVHLEQYSTNINQIPDSFVGSAGGQYNTAIAGPCAGVTPVSAQITCANGYVSIDQPILNPLANANTNLSTPTILAGQLNRPYPQYSGLSLGGFGCCGSNYNSLQATVQRRFAGGGTMLVAYTNAKLMSNTDTLTSWLESSNATGGVGQVQDYNNLKGERSLSSQDVSQRLIISYVLDLPFGHGKRFASNMSGVTDKVVSGWGVDGITTFQRGFPLKITWNGANTSLENAGLGISNIRPDVVSGCAKSSSPHNNTEWFNTGCFAAPPEWGYGTESRVDGSLRAPGVNNFDWAVFKNIPFTERFRVQFRTEFFNLFNHPQFGTPATGFNGTPSSNGFGTITSDNGDSNPRLIQFALKFLF
jgi:Carboxypeptidase regulatory-like domain